ncbi:MAG: DUF2087 domain-containing protein [Eubacteriales bacterium]|nr:DUF2087 domain-containing protein [Eubacteriales bacterium]
MEPTIDRFLNAQGQLTAYPAKRKMQLRALCYLAQRVEQGCVYSEKELNELLCKWHTFGDPATLRRDLYDHGMLERERDGSAYRRKEKLPTLEELEAKYL